LKKYEILSGIMKIAHFIGTFRKEDGVTVVLLNLIREADKRGMESVVVTGWAEDVTITSAPVIVVPSVSFPLYRQYHLPLPGSRGFEKKLKEFHPDVIHVHSPDTIGWAALQFAKKNSVPILATYHTDFMRYGAYYHISFLKPAAWALFRKFYNQMGMVTTPSPETAGDLRSNGIKNVRVIPWGVDFSRFNPSFRSEMWRKTITDGKDGSAKLIASGSTPLTARKILLCICRLTWEKDLRTLAETYQLLKEKRDDFAMVVAGDGSIRPVLENLMPGAVFMGHIEEGELSKVFASGDIFLFPSSTETFGNVTVEAIASGLVPVVANEGGSKSLVKNGETGYVAKPKDAADFARCVEALLDDPDRLGTMRIAGIEFIKNFAWDKVFDQILEAYKDSGSTNR
jgi:phosphatidylinositol alpha 1,6-mannosyltransferase